MRSTIVDFDAARASAMAYDQTAWEAHIRTAYGSAADGIIALEATARKNEPTARLRRIDTMEAHWDELNALLTELPSSQTVMDLLKSLDAPCLPIAVSYTHLPGDQIDSIIFKSHCDVGKIGPDIPSQLTAEIIGGGHAAIYGHQCSISWYAGHQILQNTQEAFTR